MTTYYVFTKASSSPTVTITSPTNGSVLLNTKKGSLLMAANATDPLGINKMELYLDTKPTPIKTCTRKATSCSTSVSLSSLSIGEHTITAKALNKNNVWGSATAVVTKR